jgi:tetratricopeptide (TPR) repeat protein
MGQCALWLNRWDEAEAFANQGWELAQIGKYEREYSRAARVQGSAALRLGKLEFAEERLSYALMRARNTNFIEEETASVVGLAELYFLQNRFNEARELLNDILDILERGPYRLDAADAYNLLSSIEVAAGNTDLAIRVATKAYEFAWCDGYPYSYQQGVENATKQLRLLDMPIPELPIFDETYYEAIPVVEVIP